MYDNVDMILRKADAPNIDFLAEIPCRLINTIDHTHNRNGSTSVTGYLGSLKVNVKEHRVKISDSSICKWYLGDNFKTLTRNDTKLLFEKLSDELHLPMTIADIIRIDFATNLIMDHPFQVYKNHLGYKSHFKRFEQSRGLYYDNSINRKELTRQLLFYDKVAEYRSKGLQIPVEFEGLNVFRYELRYLKQILKQFNLTSLKAEKLYDETFFMKLLERWQSEYTRIKKINNKKPLNFSVINTVTALKDYALLDFIKTKGGESVFLKEIETAQKDLKIDKTQAFNLRRAIKEIGSSSLISYESNIITELDNKINGILNQFH
jgi:hypothetical protein